MVKRSVLGREKLRAVLRRLPANIKKEVQDGLTKSGQGINDLQRSYVSVDDGDLRDSIRTIPFSKGGIGIIIAAGGPTTTRPVRAGQSAPYDYAMAQELGTQKMLASPFFYPAYRQKKSGMKRKASLAVKKAVANSLAGK